MKSFENIAWEHKTANEIGDYIDQLPVSERMPFLNWLRSNFPQTEIDWLTLFEELRENLSFHENIKACEDFVSWYPQLNKEDYLDNYEFIERDLCHYYLYTNNIEKLIPRIELIEEQPISGIETLTINLFNLLVYYGHFKLSHAYASSIFVIIHADDSLYGSPHYEMGQALYYDYLQHIYLDYKQTGFFDVNPLIGFAKHYDFIENPIYFTIEKNALTSELNPDELLYKLSNKKGQYGHLITEVSVHFIKYMFETYGIPFKFSNSLWNLIQTKSFFKPSNKHSFFYCDRIDFEAAFEKQIDYRMGSNFDIYFGKVWGLYYIYEFFEKSNLMPAHEAAKMQETLVWLRNDFIKFVNEDLWQMSYIFSWPKSELWEEYKPLFDSTLGKSYDEARALIRIFFQSTEFAHTGYDEQLKNISFLPNFGEFKMPFVKTEPDVGRNDPCPCGSGKKFKKCCLKENA